MSKKSEMLAEALIKAVKEGEKFIHEDDGGTCNFDSPKIYLPRWRQTEVEAACAKAGLSCFDHKFYGSKSYVICGGPLSTGQGDRRTSVAEAMCKSLKADGYDAHMYYQMD